MSKVISIFYFSLILIVMVTSTSTNAGTGARSFEGVLHGVEICFDKHRKGEAHEYHLTLKDGTTYHVSAAASLEGKMKKAVGQKVKLTGLDLSERNGKSHALSVSSVEALGGADSSSGAVSSIPAVSGSQRFLLLMVNFQDNDFTYPITEIYNKLITDPYSIPRLYNEMSYGQFSFIGDVKGWIKIPKNMAGSCDYTGWSAAAYSEAQKAGVNFSGYDKVVYVFPKNNPYTGVSMGCTEGGRGVMPGNESWIFTQVSATDMTWDSLRHAISHELGHNLGVHHASMLTCSSGLPIDSYASCNSDEYGDTSDVMGFSTAPSRHMNAGHKRALGWLPTSNIQTITSDGIYTVSALESLDTSTKVLRIAKPDTGEYYYVSFRQRIGIFDSLITEGAYVHIWNESATTQTRVLKATFLGGTKMADGRYIDDYANGILITQLSHTASTATIQVRFGSIPCIHYPPDVSYQFPGAKYELQTSNVLANVGQTQNGNILVFNTDTRTCSPASFSLTKIVPINWNLQSVSTVSNLAAGSNVTVPFSFTVDLNAALGLYTIGADFAHVSNPGINTQSRASIRVTDRDVVYPSTSVLTASAVSGGVSLSWTPATDNSGLVNYTLTRTVYVNGSSSNYTYFQLSDTSYFDTSVAQNTTYRYWVVASDLSGNSSYSNQVQVQVGGGSDTTRPNVSIASPVNGQTISGTINVQINADDGNMAISTVSLKIDGVSAGTCFSSPCNISWNTTTVSNGVHTLIAQAVDTSGNTQTSSINVNVSNVITDIIDPVTAILSPINGAMVSGGKITVSASASDNVRVQRVELYVNGVYYGTDTSAPYSFSLQTRKMKAGANTLQTKAFDDAGRFGVSAMVIINK